MYDLSPELETLFFRMQVVIGGKSALRWQTNLVNDKPFLSVFVINFVDGISHRVFLVPKLSVAEASGIIDSIDSISFELAKVEMRCAAHLTLDTPTESSDDLPFSNRVFFFTEELQAPGANFQAIVAGRKEIVSIIDDTEWKRRLEMRKPDSFIAHDSRDKATLAAILLSLCQSSA